MVKNQAHTVQRIIIVIIGTIWGQKGNTVSHLQRCTTHTRLFPRRTRPLPGRLCAPRHPQPLSLPSAWPHPPHFLFPLFLTPPFPHGRESLILDVPGLSLLLPALSLTGHRGGQAEGGAEAVGAQVGLNPAPSPLSERPLPLPAPPALLPRDPAG